MAKLQITWTKTDIAAAFGVDMRIINKKLTSEVKNQVGWKEGRQEFSQQQVFDIFQATFPLLTREEILDCLHPSRNKK